MPGDFDWTSPEGLLLFDKIIDAAPSPPRPIPNDGSGCCLRCGQWTPHGHPDAHDHKESCKGVRDHDAARKAWGIRQTTSVEAAPALARALSATRAEVARLTTENEALAECLTELRDARRDYDAPDADGFGDDPMNARASAALAARGT